MSSIALEKETKMFSGSLQSLAIPQPISPDDNTYAWSVGFGNLVINETAGLDKIVLNGVLPADARFETDTNGLYIHIGAETITVNNQFLDSFNPGNGYESYQVESLVYGDGSEISLLHNLNFTGTGESETVQGINDDNTLRGLGGDDFLYGNQGDDTLEGDEGADNLSGQEGDDTLEGGTEADNLYGGLNDDTYVWAVGDGNDVISEEGGLDKIVLNGVLPADVRFESDGGYSLIVHIGDESIIISNQLLDHYSPGNGYDVYQVESLVYGDGTEVSLLHNLTFTGTGESDTVHGINDDNTLRGLGGGDTLFAYEGDDTLEGGEGADGLYGGLNNDTYEWSVGDGNDTISEEGGLDKIVLNGVLPGDVRFENNGYSLIVHIGDEAITIGSQFSDHYSPGNGYEIYKVESLVYGDGTEVSLLNNLTFTGTDVGESIYGLNDDNTLRGLAGDDYLYGGLNNDTYEWSVGDGNDTISEEGGLDKIVLNGVLPGDVRFETNGYNLIVHIGDETITIGNQFSDYFFPGNGYEVYQVESLVYGDGSEISLLHNLNFTGTGESETVQGINDDNTLRGLGGDDYLYGYLGDDTYVWAVGDGNDYISEEGGLDKIVLNGVLPADVRFELSGFSLIVHVGDESLTISNQFLDHYSPGNGYEAYQVESLVYGDGTEVSLLHNLTFTGTGVGESVSGLNDDNTLRGLGGDDYLYAYEGADTLEGGEGADHLVGAEGGDTFVLDNLLGVDTIADFAPGDKIDVRGLFGASPGLYPSQAFANGYLRLEQVGSDTYLYADTDGGLGANPEQLLAYISSVDASTLNTETDFILPSATPNTDPVAVDDFFTGLEDIPVTGNVLLNNGLGVDSDADGNPLTVLPETITTFRGALVTLHSDGTFLYTPLPNAYGNDKFNYSLLDGQGGFDTGKVIITLTNVIKPVVALSLDAGDGNDNLIGTYLNDTMHGNGGDDILFGLSGADKLYGGDGDDILYGGKSADLLSGGANADTFVLDGITNRVDTITDFNVFEGDHLQVRDILSFDPLTDAISDFIHITQTGANSFVSVDADGAANGQNFINVARLTGVTGLDVNQLYADGNIVIQHEIV